MRWAVQRGWRVFGVRVSARTARPATRSLARKSGEKKVPRRRLPHAAAPARPREGSPLQPAAEEEELLLGCI